MEYKREVTAPFSRERCARRHLLLISIILMTIPFYCAGAVMILARLTK